MLLETLQVTEEYKTRESINKGLLKLTCLIAVFYQNISEECRNDFIIAKTRFTGIAHKKILSTSFPELRNFHEDSQYIRVIAGYTSFDTWDRVQLFHQKDCFLRQATENSQMNFNSFYEYLLWNRHCS